jgi:hypothetical protein
MGDEEKKQASGIASPSPAIEDDTTENLLAMLTRQQATLYEQLNADASETDTSIDTTTNHRPMATPEFLPVLDAMHVLLGLFRRLPTHARDREGGDEVERLMLENMRLMTCLIEFGRLH